MKKIFLLIFVFLFTIVPCSFVASADETVFVEGHYEYTVSNDEATIVYVRQSLGADITVPSSLGGYPVTSIGEYCFFGFDDATSITVGDTVKTIGEYAFGNCDKLESVVLGDSVTYISNYAFIDCVNLKSVNIPKNLQTIGDEVFFGCVSLNDISVSVENPYFSSVDGVLFDKN